MKHFCSMIRISLLFFFLIFFTGANVSFGGDPKLRIVYNVALKDSCTNYEIFSMDLNGKDKKNLSNWSGADWAYATHKDKIYFVSDRDTTSRIWFLYEMDWEGKNIRRVFNQRVADSYLAIDSTGTTALIRPLVKRPVFFRIDLSSGKILDSLVVPLINVSDPCYFPGEQSIVFTGSDKPKGGDELYKIQLDGMGLQKLTEYPANDTSAQWYETHAGYPTVIPRTNVISYFSKQNGKHSIYRVWAERPFGSQLLLEIKIEAGWHCWSSD